MMIKDNYYDNYNQDDDDDDDKEEEQDGYKDDADIDDYNDHYWEVAAVDQMIKYDDTDNN